MNKTNMIPAQMMAVVTTDNGGFDKLEYKKVNIPNPNNNEVLVKVLAAGMNNTEINTRLGWYSSSIKTGTDDLNNEIVEGSSGSLNAGWDGSTQFPLIQGTDCCGEVVSLGNKRDNSLLGKRVIIRSCMRTKGFKSKQKIWMASNFDGAFAEYVKVPSTEVFPVNCNWSDEELATIPCSYGTAENMLHISKCNNNDTVLITGASGGVGSAVIQLAKVRGSKIIAIVNKSKFDPALNLGADQTIDRNDNIIDILGHDAVNLVVDVVGGEQFTDFFKIIKPGGRYVSSGAIANPIVNFDLRDLYLKDISMLGCTTWEEPIFSNLVNYIERSLISPLLAKTFSLSDIENAQREFLMKNHFGNFVLIP